MLPLSSDPQHAREKPANRSGVLRLPRFADGDFSFALRSSLIHRSSVSG